MSDAPGRTPVLGPLGRAAIVAGIGAIFAWYVHRYYFLGDDSFITFRYAKNLVAGDGLVYNVGERVEGYTEFLWAVLLAAGMKLHAPPEIVANLLGIAAGIAILLATIRAGAARYGWRNPLIFIAPTCLALNRTFCAWSTGGLAAQLFAALIWIALLRFSRDRRCASRAPIGTAALLALAALTRPEGLLFFGAVGAVLAWDVLVRRRWRFGAMLAFGLTFGAIVGTHIAWRYHYYGYFVPNTFYAKVSGFWPEQSKRYFSVFVTDYHILWLAPLLWPLWRRARRGGMAELILPVVLYTGYLFYIGGDLFEFRFLTPILPPLYWLCQEATIEVADLCATRFGLRAATGAAAACAAVLFTSSWLPNTHSFEGQYMAAVENIKGYAERRARQGKVLAQLIKTGVLTGRELIAVSGAGALPYYAELPTLDLLGLNDVTIAHQKLAQRGEIGHEKWAAYDYVVQRDVTIIDLFPNMIFDQPASEADREVMLRRLMKRQGGKLEEYPEAIVHAVETQGHYLLFATPLPEERFRQVFAQTRILY